MYVMHGRKVIYQIECIGDLATKLACSESRENVIDERRHRSRALVRRNLTLAGLGKVDDGFVLGKRSPLEGREAKPTPFTCSNVGLLRKSCRRRWQINSWLYK
jgi:hypothetical protein